MWVRRRPEIPTGRVTARRPGWTSRSRPTCCANPNGRFRTVRIAGEVEDDLEVEDVYLAEVESTDAGDGRDIAGARLGSFDDEVLLRAERSASGEARTYRITFVAVDTGGNETRASAFVTVPGE